MAMLGGIVELDPLAFWKTETGLQLHRMFLLDVIPVE